MEQVKEVCTMKEVAKFLLSQEDIDRIALIASKEAVKTYRDEQAKAERKRARENDKIRRTKKLLSSYRRMKAAIDEEVEFTEDEKIELRWKFVEDLMGSSKAFVSKSERTVIDSEKKRQENLYCISCIDNAVRLYEEECDKCSSEEAKRRCRELKAMYIDDAPMTVQEMAEAEMISEKTVYKDLGIACSIIAVYLLGM